MTDAPADTTEPTDGLPAGHPVAPDDEVVEETEAPTPPKAGRDLKAAVGVGLLLAGLVIGTLVVGPRAFLAVVVVAVSYGAWELRRAIATRGMVVPLVPLMLGSVGMLVSAYLRGADALVVTFGLTIVGLLVWRVADGLAGAARDLSASALVAFYPIFLGGFASMMLAAPDGRQRIIVFVLVTAFSDIGGYAVGATFGRHPMAPSLSPKKSWEGFARLGAHLRRRRGDLAAAAARWTLVGRCHPRCGGRGGRDVGRPHRVEHQARPRHQGHGRAAAGARRPDGPARLAGRRRARRVAAADVVRAARLTVERSRPAGQPARRFRPSCCSSTSLGRTLIDPSSASVVKQEICRPNQW